MAWLSYETTKLTFEDLIVPTFPNQVGASFYSMPTEKPEYVTTERLQGTTEIEQNIVGLKYTDRTTVYDFWNTTLSKGLYDFTYVDHRNRCLFNSHWKTWKERWKRRNGCTYDLNIPIESPITWTPPVWAFYPMLNQSATDLYEFTTYDGSDNSKTLTIGNLGSKVIGTSAQRSNGYALKITDGSNALGASSTSLDLEFSTSKKSFSLFGQFTSRNLNVGFIDLIRVENSSTGDYVAVQFKREGTDTYTVYGDINGTTYSELAVDTEIVEILWYDFCFTYDDNNQKAYIYVWPYDESSFTNYTVDEATIGNVFAVDSVGETISSSFDTIKLLYEQGNILIANDIYLQNPMIFDGFLSPLGFNYMRRLCHIWNNKTEIYPK